MTAYSHFYSNLYAHHPLVLVALILGGWILGAIPAFVLGKRTGVDFPALAFVPAVGPYIVVLESTKRSGWLCLFIFVPLVNLGFAIWLAFTVPAAHGRTLWWALGFLTPGFNILAFYLYAFSFDPVRRPAAGGLGATYHVPPGGDWRL